MQILPRLLTTALEELPRASTGPDLTRYFLACGLILLLIVGVAFGFRRLFADSLRRRAARRSLSIVDVLPLGGKQRLSIVRCYDRTFALGIGEKEVTLVAELDAVIGDERRAGDAQPSEVLSRTARRAAAAGPAPATRGPAPGGIDFAGLLETAKERIRKAAGQAPAAPPSPEAPTEDARSKELVG